MLSLAVYDVMVNVNVVMWIEASHPVTSSMGPCHKYVFFFGSKFFIVVWVVASQPTTFH